MAVAGRGHYRDCEVILEDLAFDTITKAHCQHAHPGQSCSRKVL